MTKRGDGSGTGLGGLKSLLVGLFLLLASRTPGAVTTYYGAGYDQVNQTPGAGQLNGGYLELWDTGTDLKGKLVKGSGSLTDFLVIYVVTGAGGFTDTTHFTDAGDAWRMAVSGYNGTRRVSTYFASGFTADYAIVLNGDYVGQIFHLSEGTFADPVTAYFTPVRDPYAGTHYIDLLWSDIGITDGAHAFGFESAYVTGTGWRNLETLERYTSDSRTGSSAYFENADYFGVAPVPEMTTLSLIVFGGMAALVGVVPKIHRRLAAREKAIV
jgi:hypothetical protein